MLRSAAGKVMWVGRATVFLVGLAMILALVLGAASTALSVTGANLILGRFNAAETPTHLVSTLTDAIKPALSVHNKSGGPALRLGAAREQAPITVNAAAGTATNLSADELDGLNSADFASRNEDPGFDSFTNTGPWWLRSETDDAATVSITAPSSGFVILSGDGRFQLNHVQNSSGTPTYAQVSLSETSKSLDFKNLTSAGVSAGSPSGASHIPFGITRAFPVAAGEHTFYLTARFTGPSGSDVLIKEPTLTGFFVKHRF